MTASALPMGKQERAGLRSLRTRFARTWSALKATGKPAVPVLKNLASIPLTVAGFVCLSVASFTLSLGFACTGVLLIVLELLIADQD